MDVSTSPADYVLLFGDTDWLRGRRARVTIVGMPSLPEAQGQPPGRRRSRDVLPVAARPLLLLFSALYRRAVRRRPSPRDSRPQAFSGVDPVRLLFIGDLVVSGHGVLSHGLTVVTRTAERVALQSGRGSAWSVVSAPDLTIAKLAARGTIGAARVDVAYVALGIPDVLLLTRPERWARELETVVRRIQRESGLHASRVVISGIPPLFDFRPVRPSIRRIADRQVDRLNAASAEVAAALPGVTFVAFPTWRLGDMYIERAFSWRRMHDAWAETLAAALLP